MNTQPIHARRTRFNAVLLLALCVAWTASGATLYVWQDSPSPTPPYTTWATAAKNIQDAVNAAQAGQTVMVTNGVYASGVQYGEHDLAYRVVVDKPITLQSVNGPGTTVIEGGAPAIQDTWSADGAIGCIRLGANARLSGFTLRNGWSPTMDFYVGMEGGGAVCADSAVLTNCVIENNHAFKFGGGVSGGTLYNCIVRGNTAFNGGGAYNSTLFNCGVEQNTAKGDDHGNYGNGGGVYDCAVYNSVVSGNSAEHQGGGAYGGTLYNCTVTDNAAVNRGGGVYQGTLYNCIVYFNTSEHANEADANYSQGYVKGPWVFHWVPGSSLNYCCTTPMPFPYAGTNNIVLDPRLASASHLSADSPCIGAGNAAYAIGDDIDGELWSSPPSIGCDEYTAGTANGPLSVAVSAAYTNVAPGFPVFLTATIDGHAAANIWDFGDGVIVSNRLEVSHAWSQSGTYPVVLRAFNEEWPDGIGASVLVNVSAARIHYVDAGSLNPVPPYDSWATAATNIQDAVDVTFEGGTVLVTNGVYATGGRAVAGTMTNRVAVDKTIAVRSVNGPALTVIKGASAPGGGLGNGAVRCVYLGSNATLDGFTLTNGHTSYYVNGDSGGGAWCADSAILTNCIITGNAAQRNGGGAYGGTLLNCTLTGNSSGNGNGGGVSTATLYNCTVTGNSGRGASESTLFNCLLSGNSAEYGGGALGSTLHNCTVTGNSADYDGGGVYDCRLYNCIVYFNTVDRAGGGANYGDSSPTLSAFYGSSFNYSCTTPLPTNGVGNIDLDALLASASHLSASSPCIRRAF